jgi:hypothetical protein
MGSNLETVRETYEAFASGNIEAVLATFDDDITWVEAEGGPYGGVYHGPDELLTNVFGPLDQQWDVFRVEPERFVDGGDTIVTTGTYSGTYSATGESFEAEFAHVWELEDDNVVRMQQYVDTALHNEPIDA